ncbi:MAG: hypothetical protein JXP34_11730 [Planctomycetes bacterium]|nr:hypothetical protein [Planctomycetota bacterium]
MSAPFVASLLLGTVAPMADIAVDFASDLGRIRPLHGGNCGPIAEGETIDLSAHYREVGFPYIRLHDCHWPNPDVVDIHVLFPEFGADPERPESYDFSRTDDYIRSILQTGARIVFRLGESIEHSRKKYHVHPPADAAKWAQVAIGVIRHYNEGWAGGFRHGIRYWEIWNEPENRPAMWTGSDEDYFRLYEAASKAIRARFPDVKVGGPSLGYTGKVEGGRFVPGDFLIRFLDRVKERDLPLDFFSWHLYTTDPSECVTRAIGIRAALDARGLRGTELHFNEWNYLPGDDWTPLSIQGQGFARERFFREMGGAPGAAFTAGVLLRLQDSPVDVANFYRSDAGGFGLFTPHGVPTKAFHAFRAFRRLLDTPLRLACRGAEPGRLAVCAGTNAARTEIGILIGRLGSASDPVRLSIQNLPGSGSARFEVFVIDAKRDLEKVREGEWPEAPLDLGPDLAPPAVCLVRIALADMGQGR